MVLESLLCARNIIFFSPKLIKIQLHFLSEKQFWLPCNKISQATSHARKSTCHVGLSAVQQQNRTHKIGKYCAHSMLEQREGSAMPFSAVTQPQRCLDLSHTLNCQRAARTAFVRCWKFDAYTLTTALQDSEAWKHTVHTRHQFWPLLLEVLCWACVWQVLCLHWEAIVEPVLGPGYFLPQSQSWEIDQSVGNSD